MVILNSYHGTPLSIKKNNSKFIQIYQTFLNNKNTAQIQDKTKNNNQALDVQHN